MIHLRWRLLFVVIFFGQVGISQKLKRSDELTLTNLENHIHYLADDKLEGRRTGTRGEALAMDYIGDQFKQIGLRPKGTEGYFQAFDVNEGKQVNEATHFIINAKELKINDDYFPFAYSPNVNIEALPAIAVEESGMPWFINLKDVIEENTNNPHFDLNDYIHKQAVDFKKRGATALIFYNTSAKDDQLKFDGKDKAEATGIPVVYVTKPAAKIFFKDLSASLDIKLKIDIGEKKRTGHNVVGYIDNGAPNTVVIGAHFDHLGYGEDGNSMLRTGEHLIHNGADDNASGTAALIELGRLLKNSKLNKSNYLFIAFSGEELGLFGSKYFVENPTVSLNNVNYMINMDMVGRLNDSTKVLTIGGYGTSPEWSSLINQKVKKSAFVIKIDSSGTGPSDHTSFYRKNIPVLFFFTGIHADYHKPTDDYDKINYTGELSIVNYIYSLIEKENKEDHKLVFAKTRETQSNTSSRFSVTLGIMPDYTFAGTGVRVDGVSDGRPAQKAGLQTGDVILQLGAYNVTSLENYMEALGKFKKGDATVVKFKRGNENKEAPVQF
ncbi:MAG: M28 family peptidase [Chitinophagales bacterium]